MLATLVLAGCGGSGGSSSSRSSGAASHRNRAATHRRVDVVSGAPTKLTYRSLYSLPAALRDPASAPLGGGRFVLIGGLNGADTSTAGIEVVDLHGVTHNYSLALAQHDAQGAALGTKVYVFGGGSFSELDHIVSFDPASGSVSTVGALPHAESDVAVAQIGGTAYIVGGYDGTSWFNTILAWRPGGPVHVAGHIPVGLRYSAVTAVDGRLLIIGGSTPTAASDAIYSFDPATGSVRQIGKLPHPVTHGGAATLGSSVYLVGGRGDLLNSQTSSVLGIDPRTGAVKQVARLPQPLSDPGVLTVGNAIVVAGGLTSANQAVTSVGALTPAAR